MPTKVKIVSCTLILLYVAAAYSHQSRPFPGNKEARAYTRDLQSVDKVELLKLKKDGDLWRGQIESTKTVEGSQAKELASLWRTQTYYPNSAICHFPGYAIKFFSKEKLVVYATLCWECRNIGFQTPDLKHTQGFGGEDKKGQELLKVFRSAFSD